jgi:Uma2 family endonuclease
MKQFTVLMDEKAVTVNVPPPSAKDQFHEFSRLNPELRIEQTKEGNMIIMLPAYTETGNKNFKLNTKLGIWVEQNGEGEGFDSSTGFILPNGAKRAPDASWIRRERWEALPKKARQKFAHVCPDFVVELRSRTDRLKTLQKKMDEYIENGAELGWLIDPFERKVHVYQPNQAVVILDNPENVSGDPLLPGFVLQMSAIWD